MARNLGDCAPLLVMLTRATRVATEQQLETFAELYPLFQGSCTAATRRLLHAGLLTCHDLTIRMREIHAPLFTWRVGDSGPDCATLAADLARGLTEAPWCRTRLFWATRKAVSLVGGISGVNRQPLQVQHDLCTTQAYLKFLEQGPHPPGLFWVGEDVLRFEFPHLFKKKRPDATILQSPDCPIRIIETGGTYSADDLRHIHRCYARERIPYELW